MMIKSGAALVAEDLMSEAAQVIAELETELERLRHSTELWLTVKDPTRAAWYNGAANTLHKLAATLTEIKEELE